MWNIFYTTLVIMQIVFALLLMYGDNYDQATFHLAIAIVMMLAKHMEKDNE